MAPLSANPQTVVSPDVSACVSFRPAVVRLMIRAEVRPLYLTVHLDIDLALVSSRAGPVR
ncbi:hypothetical protein EJF18_30549 [Clavispora lusitaniae]|uniref:Uncharacterized protein n=1 Tax=Clavispora lusitaniae TaxID=36911 RepID=A0ACD0WJ62_CLALS|nr:hypothetical protein EJF14_30549 [Clavispora lusitaniae]QFZ33120.1 hypothetical protein EJF16_30549 [Clavispora lusitaniae]QFZ38791.1 hypothetical protein EJF15_30549 [Clavispora lusitaniae]QFZ44473.1 hypothetical protein EJF18_30549 [Clavispora lusitaniae]QFZ50150.1 hypothetical protein EJF17_30549 [Clavispora lusitaniae]